jgi:OOP family OmpA-OmpF porin
MEKRVLAVVIMAAFAGSAAAQSASQTSDKASSARSSPAGEPYVTSADGRRVMSGSGDCVRTGSWTPGTAGCAPQASRSAASAAPVAAAPVAAAPAAASPSAAAGASRSAAVTPNSQRALGSAPILQPATDAYLSDSQRQVVTDSTRHCVRTGRWSPEKAAEPCDAVPRASTPPAPIAAAPAPAPEPAPAPKSLEQPQQQALAPAPVIEKVTLSTDVLFEFNKSELRQGGQERLDQLAKNAQGANVDKVVVIGHADRIASEDYNKELSERRAQAVSDYLAQKGVDKSRLQIEGKGESQPVTGDDCKKMGAESAKNAKLVACLQPDRRVEVELLGSRESTASSPSAPASTGATGASSSSSSTSGSASGSSSK